MSIRTRAGRATISLGLSILALAASQSAHAEAAEAAADNAESPTITAATS